LVWHENNVDNILIFLVVARWSRTFQLPTLASQVQGSWEGTRPGQLTSASHRDILFHTMSCSVYKLRKLARKQRSLLGDGLGSVHWMVSNCIALGFYILLLLLLLL